MHYLELKDYFSEQVSPAHPNEWEFEEVLHEIEDLAEDQQFTLLQVVPTVWPISQNLCHSVLQESVRHADGITQQNMAEWLRQILFHYETGGLINARAFMAEADLNSVSNVKQENSIALKDQVARLNPFARGLSGLDLTLRESSKIYTDTEYIYLPEKIDMFPDRRQNLLFYKCIIALQCGFVCLGTLGRQLFFQQTAPGDSNHQKEPQPEVFLEMYTDQTLAQDIYQLTELGRTIGFLRNEYPGLIRQAAPLIKTLLNKRDRGTTAKHLALEDYFISIFSDQPTDPMNNLFLSTAEQSQNVVDVIYRQINQLDGDSSSFSFLPFMDRFNLAESKTVFDRRVATNKKKFETSFGDFLLNQQDTFDDTSNSGNMAESASSARIQLNDRAIENRRKKTSQQLIIDNKSIQLPDDILDLVRTIQNDLGSLPESYVSAAFGISGGGRNNAKGEKDSGLMVDDGFLPYDEWDYRRQGYRKNWCSLRERELMGVQSDFIPLTLQKYHGQLKKIKRQFELMHTQERFARRRRSGDDIDLDALIDSLGDQCAGLPPSENVFIQLIRDQRSISTLFLVDMSNSTEGWVGQSIKEALILLCEAMEIVGDDYGIYGFSGMRRMRSEVYKIKEISDRYDAGVKERLSAIGPKEYTRMGPPIRHMIKHFKKVDTRTRLLVILSDGKPEDYDDYKSEYAIEDTRKALAEAKGAGIQPYCITIDKEAHDYLEHLFGIGNYTFVPSIELLPSRLTEIYRILTR
jgi:nitric oxide reductase NorD protein